MVRRSPDGAEGSLAGSATPEADSLIGDPPPKTLPPFAEVFVPQFEQIRAVLDRLPGFALVPIEVPSRDVAWVFGSWLSLMGRRVHVVFDDIQWRMLPAAIVAAPPGAGGLAMVISPRELGADVRMAFHLLNQRRDTIAARLNVPLLWCGNADFLRMTAELAPDFWSVREVPLRIDVPDAFAASSGPWDVLVENPSWQLSPMPGTNREHDLRQYPLDGLFADPTPEKLRSDARFVLDLAERSPVDPGLLELALAILRASDDRLDLALGVEIAGARARDRGDLDGAESKLREAITLFEEADNHAGVVRISMNLAGVLRESGRLVEAEALLQNALSLTRRVDDWREEARVLLELAMVQNEARQHAQARESIEQARARFERLGDRMGLATTHLMSAITLRETADFEGAIQEIERATALAEQSGDASGTATALFMGALVRRDLGDASMALAMLHKAAALVRDPRGVSILEAIVDGARSLPDSVALERDAFVRELETRMAAFRAASVPWPAPSV